MEGQKHKREGVKKMEKTEKRNLRDRMGRWREGDGEI
jgi:hypothetical protein